MRRIGLITTEKLTEFLAEKDTYFLRGSEIKPGSEATEGSIIYKIFPDKGQFACYLLHENFVPDMDVKILERVGEDDAEWVSIGAMLILTTNYPEDAERLIRGLVGDNDRLSVVEPGE